MDLHTALANGNPACDEIWVMQGVYTPGPNRNDSFTLTRNVRMYGGFAGTETERSERDPVSNKTVLSGDIDGDDNRDAFGITRSADDIEGDNSHVVVRINLVQGSQSITPATVIDGFIITGGDDSFPGSGLYCRASHHTVECSPTLHRLEFYGNRAVGSGGAGGALAVIALEGGKAMPALSHATFNNNSGGGGGAVYVLAHDFASEASPDFDGVTFSGNSADTGGAVMVKASGAGVAEPSFRNSSFSGNQAVQYGGAMALLTASPTQISNVSPILQNLTFVGNSIVGVGPVPSYGGGAVYTFAINGTIEASFSNSIFWDNAFAGETNQVQQWAIDGVVNLALGNSIVQGGAAGIVGDSGNAFATGPDNLDEDPLLGPLADNGGFTQTHMPGAGSPAVDAGDDLVCPETDQRGVARPQGGACDIGAVEQQPGEGFDDLIFADSFEP